jgi:hypothetical protein
MFFWDLRNSCFLRCQVMELGVDGIGVNIAELNQMNL